jgi:hypothetical protein
MQKLRRDTEDELAQVRESIRILLQKFLDNDITKATFDEGHAPLLMQRKVPEEKILGLSIEHSIFEKVEELVNYLRTVLQTFPPSGPIEMRKLHRTGIPGNHDQRYRHDSSRHQTVHSRDRRSGKIKRRMEPAK